MAKKRDKLRAQRQARHKKRRAKAARPSRDRNPQQVAADPSQGRSWPAGPCYLSENWYEQGAHCHAVFSRVSADGRAVVARIEVDLAEKGVIAASALGGLTEDQLPAYAAQVADDAGEAMVEVVPAQVVAVVTEGVAHGRSGGHRPPSDLDAVVRLFGDIDPASAPLAVQVGSGDTGPKEKPESWFSRALGKLLGS